MNQGLLGYDKDGEGLKKIIKRIGLNQHTADDLRLLGEEIEVLLESKRQLDQIKRIINGNWTYD